MLSVEVSLFSAERNDSAAGFSAVNGVSSAYADITVIDSTANNNKHFFKSIIVVNSFY
jgi:hypothetical protein